MCQICSNDPILKCGACAQTEYCSETCATIHWNIGHQYECIAGGSEDDNNKKRERPKDDDNNDTWEEGDDDVFVLITDSNDRISLERRAMRKSRTLRNFFEDTDAKELSIPIDTRTLEAIVFYLSNNKIPVFDKKYPGYLYRFLNAIYYLDVSKFNFKDILTRYNVFDMLMNSKGVPTLSQDIIRIHIIPTLNIGMIEEFQKKNPNLWELTAKPWMLIIMTKMFPKSVAAKKHEKELLFAVYAYNKIPNKLVSKTNAMDIYGLDQQEDLAGLNLQDGNYYRLNDVMDQAILKYGSIQNLEKIIAEKRQRRRIKLEQIAEAKDILYEKYGHTFEHNMKKYKENNNLLFKTADELVKNVVELNMNGFPSYLKKIYKKEIQQDMVLVLVKRNPRIFGLFTNAAVSGNIETAIRFISEWLKSHNQYMLDLKALFETQGVIPKKEDSDVVKRILSYYSDERNPFQFDAFRTMLLKKYDDLLNVAIYTENWAELRKMLTPEKFKEIIPEIVGQENSFYFKDLKLEKK
jgi:hypothetical protein